MASEGLLCYNDLLYQAGRDTGWENSPKMIDSPQFLPDYRHNRLNQPTLICANKVASLTHHLQTKPMFFFYFISTRLLFIPLRGSGQGREPQTSFYHPRLAASGAVYRLLAKPVRTRQRGSGRTRPEDDSRVTPGFCRLPSAARRPQAR